MQVRNRSPDLALMSFESDVPPSLFVTPQLLAFAAPRASTADSRLSTDPGSRAGRASTGLSLSHRAPVSA
jgi:hypothetical protein